MSSMAIVLSSSPASIGFWPPLFFISWLAIAYLGRIPLDEGHVQGGNAAGRGPAVSAGRRRPPGGAPRHLPGHGPLDRAQGLADEAPARPRGRRPGGPRGGRRARPRRRGADRPLCLLEAQVRPFRALPRRRLPAPRRGGTRELARERPAQFALVYPEDAAYHILEPDLAGLILGLPGYLGRWRGYAGARPSPPSPESVTTRTADGGARFGAEK